MVVMNGLPGAMGKEVAAACQRRGMVLAPVALTGSEFGGTEVEVGGVTVSLVDGTNTELADGAAAAAKQAAEEAKCAALVCIDYTHPSAVGGNAAWYARHSLDFVMGTTGGDRSGLTQEVMAEAGSIAVVAPNMAKQIVALQAALQQMAEEFPGSFSGYSLSVVESHQSTKADTSGTAKAISASLAALTNEQDSFVEDDIVRVRDPPKQLEGGGMTHKGCSPVPEAAVNGHAFHTYSLTSGDGNVEFQIRHNVAGRSTYAEGTVDACVFLGSRASAGASQTRYDMIDVLKAGEM